MRTIEDLRRLSGELGVGVEAVEDTSILAEPVRAGNLILPNSLAIHPMEGADGSSSGAPGELTFRRYSRFAGGRAGLLWFEAIAAASQGRANPRQLWLTEDNKDDFAALIKHIRQKAIDANGAEHRPVIVAQLTHSGRYSKPQGWRKPLIAQNNPYLDSFTLQQKPEKTEPSKLLEAGSVITDEQLNELVDDYVRAAKLAYEAGFDAVDIKACHGYLINELLGSHNRKGKYGGPFENRTRFLLEIIDKIHHQLGKDAVVTTRLGIYDAIPYPYGWGVDKDDYTKADLSEPKKLIQLLYQRGVRLINITASNPYYNPHVGRPFNEPIAGGYEQPEHPLVGVSRLVNLTGQIQKEFSEIAIVATGYSWLGTLMPNVGAAAKAGHLASIIGVGRMALAYPDFAKDIIDKGLLDENKICIGCSGCTQIMRDGGTTGCVVRDNEVYGPIFEHGRMSDRDNLARLASACRKCHEPTCQLGCPADVEIPRFISLFLDGEERRAYEVLREANVFPEVCAWLCPVEQQCQGQCLQRFIGDAPIPIADIQRYLAEQANKKGWSKLRIPKKSTGKNIAVIGAGPAGLSCASLLLEAGHTVTVFDKSTEFGGMIASVIPPDKQSYSLKNEISAIFADVPKQRMVLRLGKELDAQFNLDNILDEGFDAVFIGMGLEKSASIKDEDSNINGLWNAMEFLSAAKKQKNIDIAGKRLAAIGGGNTAMDVVLTAKRLGAGDVYVIYRRSFKEMPAWVAERQKAIKAGVHFLILTHPLGFSCSDGKLTQIKVCPTRLGQPDDSGRRRPEPVESSTYTLDMDIVVEAVGQKSPQEISKILPGVELTNGLIRTIEGTSQTSRPGVFAGGDLVRGASTVVAAVADGMAAANEINKFLKR